LIFKMAKKIERKKRREQFSNKRGQQEMYRCYYTSYHHTKENKGTVDATILLSPRVSF
jgi:hypothetical protein